MATIAVRVNRETVSIDRAAFELLLENSSVNSYADYVHALEDGRISLDDLIKLSRRADIPYSLFFAPLPLVQAQLMTKTAKLLAGTSKKSFSISARQYVGLPDVELIVKDLLRKQEVLKKHDSTLKKNQVIGLLGKPGNSPDADAEKLRAALGLDRESMRAARRRADLLDLMIARLEAHQILVSMRAPRGVMPQELKAKFSGITIKDSKVPYIFLAGGGTDEEPTGRRIFTLALLTVLVARKRFVPVDFLSQLDSADAPREFDIAGALLMPADEVRGVSLTTLDEIKAAADAFNVTPSAMTVRAMRLQLVEAERAHDYLAALRREFEALPKPRLSTPLMVNAVRKYAGRALSTRMLAALDAGKVSRGDFCRVVCLNKITPDQIDEFRAAVA